MNEIINDYKNVPIMFIPKKEAAPVSEMAAMLKSIVQAEGVDIYRDVPKLVAQMQSKGAKECDIKQVELALCASTFVRYLDQLSNGLSPIDINNIILSTEATGLSAQAARNVVFDILYSLNVPQLGSEVPVTEGDADQNYPLWYVPPREYINDLNEIKRHVVNGKKLSNDQFSQLNTFLGARIPEAYTVMGMVYCAGLDVEKDEQKALEHWRFAAAHGNADAFGFLGDYYYNRDNKQAYSLYSRPGAIALNETRWQKFRNLLKVKNFHFKQMIFLGLLTLLTSVFMFAFKDSVITGGHTVAAVVCTIFNVLFFSGSVYIHIKNPFQDLRHFTLPIILMFLIFVLILI